MSLKSATNLGSQIEFSINWKDIQLDPSAKSYKDYILGEGKFGTVFRAKYTPSTGPKLVRDVAVKVVSKSFQDNLSEYRKYLDMIIQEIHVIREANDKIRDSDCTVKVFGGVKGILPSSLASIFRLDTTVNFLELYCVMNQVVHLRSFYTQQTVSRSLCPLLSSLDY